MHDNEATNALTARIIGAAITVHRHLGPGLLESAYHACLTSELRHLRLRVEQHVPVGMVYRDVILDCAYRIDLVVERTVIVELKVVRELAAVHTAQLRTYLRLAGLHVGLLINFNVEALAAGGIRRVIYGRVARPSETPGSRNGRRRREESG